MLGDDGSALRVHFGRGIGRGKRNAKGTATGKLLLAQVSLSVKHLIKYLFYFKDDYQVQ